MYRTDRLILKNPEAVNVEEVLDYYRENKTHLKPFEPLRSDDFYTYRQQSINLEFDLEHFNNKTGLKLFICKPHSKKIIGILNFSQIVYGGFLSCYVGYGLDHSVLNQGYMTEAIKKGIEIIFDEYGLHRIEANVMPRNQKSINILLNLNFHEEGLAKHYLRINDVWEDHIHYVLLNE